MRIANLYLIIKGFKASEVFGFSTQGGKPSLLADLCHPARFGSFTGNRVFGEIRVNATVQYTHACAD